MKQKIHIKRHTRANPWAICHASVGPAKSAKFERCVRKVKSKNKLVVDSMGGWAFTDWKGEESYIQPGAAQEIEIEYGPFKDESDIVGFMEGAGYFTKKIGTRLHPKKTA